jgi:hypothetical protein
MMIQAMAAAPSTSTSTRRSRSRACRSAGPGWSGNPLSLGRGSLPRASGWVYLTRFLGCRLNRDGGAPCPRDTTRPRRSVG